MSAAAAIATLAFPAHAVMRSRIFQRRVAWLGLVAMLLVACAPTISQWRVSTRAPAPTPAMHHAMGAHDGAGASHAMHDHASIAGHGHAPAAPDDCWKACGYCDFFTQMPSVGGVSHPPLEPIALPQPLPPVFVAARLAPRFVIAARPRGPPSFA